MESARFENTCDSPEADAHPLPLDTRYREAPLTDSQLAVIVLAVAVQDTDGAAGGAVVVHTVLGCTWFQTPVGDARHQKKNV
ncbi:hypothetical protein [Candidatus Poriferisocius sp.]|uniref:hypothetical protein n=1 Tax=Candidatus Poriferisocius sp. TaxID=3101276 RepID=UPI003B5A1FD3